MKYPYLLLMIVGGWLWVSGCAPTPSPAPTSTPTPIPAVTVSGFVFRDLNANGLRDTREPGEPDITVSIYDADNNLVAAATTDINGDYVLKPEPGRSEIIRNADYVVIFSDWPDQLTPGPHGEDSNTEMQFVVGGATGVNFGLFNPDQYAAPRQATESHPEN